MRFNLHVTTRNGVTFKTVNSPYDSRDATRRSVTMILAGNGPAGTPSADAEFARRVSDTTIGESISHPATGITFRTERTQP